MNINHLVLMMGLLLTCVGGYFSVVGLATIFAGAFWSVVIMAIALETSKVVAASWIYRQWPIAPVLIRSYMVLSVIILVCITSMGIFGYLSKAHIDQTVLSGGGNDIKIENLERQIARQQGIITDAETVLYQLDEAVAALIEYDRIRGPEGSIAVRDSQKEERQSLNDTINTAYERIEGLQSELIPLQQTQLSLEAEIGPLKYIAELIYGKDEAANYFDTAVRWIIIVLVSVFDPLAIVMIIAGNVGLSQQRKPQIQMMTKEEIMKDVDNFSSQEGYGLGG